MHRCVGGALMSIYACQFLIVSLSRNIYEHFFGYTVLEIQRCIIWYLPSWEIVKCFKKKVNEHIKCKICMVMFPSAKQ